MLRRAILQVAFLYLQVGGIPRHAPLFALCAALLVFFLVNSFLFSFLSCLRCSLLSTFPCGRDVNIFPDFFLKKLSPSIELERKGLYRKWPNKRSGRLFNFKERLKRGCLRWCYTGRFATTIFSAKQLCNIIGTLFQRVVTLFQQAENRRFESFRVLTSLLGGVYFHKGDKLKHQESLES